MRGFVILGLAGLASAATPFDQTVQPVLKQTCALCHNEKLSSGGLNIAPFMDSGSLVSNRDGWERILAKLRTGEMPPKGIPRPPAEKIDALVKFVDSEFDRADRAKKPDPGRVTARRMNRAEYANTVRDLLGVHFRANEAFPPDDSGFGFDNIGDVLTVSPVLLQQYLSAAEQIASHAVGADPMPKPGLFNTKDKVRRRGIDTVELPDYIDYEAEYIVRALIIGHRGKDAKPVTLAIAVDGKTLKTVPVDSTITLVNQQGGATQRTSEEVRVFLPEGQHTFKASFLDDDDVVKTVAEKDQFNPSKNIYPESIEIAGPFPTDKPPKHDVLICDPASGAACVDRILNALAHRAYRRPVLKSEIAELMNVDRRALAAGYNAGQSLQFAITAMLISPQFLFRVEHDPRSVARISDVELASRLSYFLWSSMPDAELLRVAESGKLHQPAVLDAQVQRMLADPKSSALAENFAGQWLELRSLDAQKPDPKKFPEWGPALKEAMRTETTMFFNAVLRENRPISDFITGKYSFLNERLAKHYGIPGVTGPEFRRVELSTDERSGIFTQASVLTVSSYPARTSVVLRGKYLLGNVLGAPPPPPPPDVPPLDEAAVGTSKSLRQQMESHRANAVCASCHARMDPLGFALENYDAIGRWRTQDGKFPVDASGTFPNGKTFQTPEQMKELLAANLPEFARCLTEKMLTYALGRGIESYDRMTVRDIVRQTAENEYRFQSIVHGIVHSLPFQERRGAAKEELAQK